MALTLTLICLSWGATALAEEVDLADEADPNLEEVIVSASRVKEKVKDTSATVNTLNSADLENIKYRNPQELLTRIPGIFSHNFGNDSELTSIRVPTHFTNPYTLVLLDGVPISGYGSGSSGQLGDVNSNTVGRVEVVKGPASALYGSNAIGGVINLITRRPSETPTANINLEYGQEGRFRTSGFVSSTRDHLGYSLDVNYQDDEGWRDHSAMEKKGGNLKAVYGISGTSDLTFKLDYMSRDSETSGSLEQADFEENWQQSYNTFTFSQSDRMTPAVSYNQVFGNGELIANLNYRHVEEEAIPDYSIRRQGPTFVGSHNINKDKAGNLQLVYSRYLDFLNSRFVIGFDAENGTKDADTIGLTVDWDPATRQYTGYTSGDLSKSFGIDTKVMAPYVRWEARPSEKFKVNIGGRYDSTTYEVNDKLTETDSESDFSKVTPKAGAIYDFTSTLNSYLSFSQGFVVPTSSQLLTSSWSNPDLEPEQAENYEVGLRSAFYEGRFNLDLAIYQMEIEDKIIAQDMGGWSRQYVNAGRTSQKGVETTAIAKPSSWYSLAVAYTYAKNKFEEFSDGTTDFSGNVMPRSPDHRFNFRVATTPTRGLRLELEMDAVSAIYADDANEHEYKRPPLFNLRASYDWDNWSAWAHILNLSDRKYSTYASYGSSEGVKYYPGAPLTAFVGLSYGWGN